MSDMGGTVIGWSTFVVAALLEVGGDAVVRKGLKSSASLYVLLGCLLLGAYGIVVNTAKMVDFSKLLGVYVAVFAVISVLAGKFVFKEWIPASTWLGLSVIIVGGLIIQFGNR